MQELKDRYETRRMEYDRYARLLANRDMPVKMQANWTTYRKAWWARFLTAPDRVTEVRFQDLVMLWQKRPIHHLAQGAQGRDTGDLKEMRWLSLPHGDWRAE